MALFYTSPSDCPIAVYTHSNSHFEGATHFVGPIFGRFISKKCVAPGIAD
jgi:hypothetical protein